MKFTNYSKKENYLHDFDPSRKEGHIYSLLLEENKNKLGKKILYVGCNTGSTLPLVKRYCDVLYGCDVNKDAINKAQEMLISEKRIYLEQASLTNLPYDVNSFDTVILFDIWEHIFPEDSEKALNELSRVLKKDGNLLVFVPRAEENSPDKKIKIRAFDETHCRFFYTAKQLEDDFSQKFTTRKIAQEMRANPSDGVHHNSWFAIFKKRPKVFVFTQCYNELQRGFLESWVDHVYDFADGLVVYDDASTDGSYEFLKEKSDLVLRGQVNNHKLETIHKDMLMKEAKRKFPDVDLWFWLDIDEFIESLFVDDFREICQDFMASEYDGMSFPEVTIWRSECYRRIDYLGHGRFVRLWKNHEKLSFVKREMLHLQQYPIEIEKVENSTYGVLHMGYARKELIEERWKVRSKLGVPVHIRKKCLDESELMVEHVNHLRFPSQIRPVACSKPKPTSYNV